MEYTSLILRRLGWSVVVLAGLSVVVFVIARMVPGDPARMALGPTASAEQVQQLRREMGLDRPLVVQYGRYLSGLLRGDLGSSLLTRRPVTRDLAQAFPATLELVVATILLTTLLGLPFGVLAARNKDGWFDGVARIVSLLGVVTPAFFLALLLQLLVGYNVPGIPVTGRLAADLRFSADVTGFMTIDALLAGRLDVFADALRHLLLPTIALSAASIGQIMRITRSSMIDVSRKDYVEAERAFGLPGWLVTFKYMLRPSSIPTITILGLEFASLLGNAFLVEMVFSLPGMASYGVRAILQNDFNAVMGTVLVTGLFFVVVNVAVDVLLGIIDPRIRLRGART
ncbi:MAG: ABC transporter permease [Trueperaceae bacterium]